MDQSWVPGLLFWSASVAKERASRGLSFIEEENVLRDRDVISRDGGVRGGGYPHPFGDPHSTHVTWKRGIKA